MKAKKGKKDATIHSEKSTQPAIKADTSRWESLLAGRKSNGAAPAPGKLTLSHRISVSSLSHSKQDEPQATPGTQLSNGHGTTCRENVKRLKMDKVRGVSATALDNGGSSNWEKLLNVPVSEATTTDGNAAGLPAAAAAVTHAGKQNKSKNKNKRSRPVRSQEDCAVPLDFFARTQAARSTAVAGVRSQGANSVGEKSGDSAAAAHHKKGGGDGDKKRKRGRTSRDDGRGEDSGGGGGAQHRKKWPKPNSLNLAFQAKKAADEVEKQEGKDGRSKGYSTAGGVGKGGGRGKAQMLTSAEQAQYVGLDCEMVGVGPGGCRSALARCCMVDWGGNIIYDKHVVPNERVTDFRTFVSGVKAKDLRSGVPLRQCQNEVAHILDGKVLVGHALHNDLKALLLSHPARMTRDTAKYRPYQKARGKTGGKLYAKSLKILALDHLDRTIQEGQHHPAEDATAAMDLYKIARQEWEKSLSAAGKMRGRRAVVDQQDR